MEAGWSLGCPALVIYRFVADLALAADFDQAKYVLVHGIPVF